ncbi:MAG: hypothetical protein WAV46_00495 [Candidatus Moraniibacteriota bacterium]
MNLKGSSLVFSLVVLSVLLISALSVATVAVTTSRSSLSSKSSNISFQVADSAVEIMLREIYQVNDKHITLPDPPTGSLAEPSDLASSIKDSTQDSTVRCASGQITGKVGVGDYTAVLYESDTNTPPNFTPLACDDADWRTKVIKIKFQGVYQGASRAVEVGIKPLL